MTEMKEADKVPFLIAIPEPQNTLIENRPAVSTGIGQASRRPAGPFRQHSIACNSGLTTPMSS